ncbi:MAG TPA: hypothetical protein VIM11_06670 [Tepidisphaeraceae bacterium]
MTVLQTPSIDLNEAERRLLLAEVHESLRNDGTDVLLRAKAQPGGLAQLDHHVNELIPIVRRSTATRLEPYLAQILDDICTRCPLQEPSAFCALRHEGTCIFFKRAGTIVAAVRRALREVDIGRELQKAKE